VTLDVIDRSLAKRFIMDGLRLPTNAEPDSICAELIRSALWAATRTKSTSHSREFARLATATGCAAFGLSKETAANNLESLEQIGDVRNLGDGFWAPGVTRHVRLPGLEECLLLGGTPSACLNGKSDSLTHHGIYRRLLASEAIRATNGLRQELSSWLGLPGREIAEWGRGLLGCDLEPYREPITGSPFRVYGPGLARRSANQGRRWCPVGAATDGRYLAERQSSFGQKTYRIVAIQAQVVVASAALPLGNHEIRRLRYALDRLAGNPVAVRERSYSDAFQMELFSEVPVPEQRLFAAFGRLETGDRYYPRLWTFDNRYRSVVVGALDGLGIHLTDN
jgi:hypothetical protein